MASTQQERNRGSRTKEHISTSPCEGGEIRGLDKGIFLYVNFLPMTLQVWGQKASYVLHFFLQEPSSSHSFSRY